MSDPTRDYVRHLRRALPLGLPGRRRLVQEVEAHLADEVAAHVARGVAREQARREVVAEFGDVQRLVRQLGYDVRLPPAGGSPRHRRVVRAGHNWATRYTPLTGVLVAAFLVAVILPSALNVPQSAPSHTLEFAPVPPEDQERPPPGSGNLSSLGLGRSSGPGEAVGAGSGGVPRDLAPPSLPGGIGDRPVTKRCVGDPPRQTEDPLSPPCVAHFEGDNGGATARGVTRDEVRLLVYFDIDRDPSCDTSSQGVECKEPGTLVDLAEAPEDDEFVWTRVLRWYQRYFNERFQTYGRFVHLWVHYGEVADTPESVRGDAIRALDEVGPFAVIAYPTGNAETYIDTVAHAGVVTFLGDRSGALGTIGADAASFRRWPGLVWSRTPSLEQRARLFVDYVCSKVVPYPVSFSGNGDRGQPRGLGLVETSNQSRTDLLHTPTWCELASRGAAGSSSPRRPGATRAVAGRPRRRAAPRRTSRCSSSGA